MSSRGSPANDGGAVSKIWRSNRHFPGQGKERKSLLRLIESKK